MHPLNGHAARWGGASIAAPSVSRLARLGAALVRRWHERTRQRAQLAALDRRMLRDIGVTPSDAARECEKPFWRA